MRESLLFEEGKKILETITEMSVLGVLPFLPIEDEDALTEGKSKTKDSL
jgi:cobyric acid synthase